MELSREAGWSGPLGTLFFGGGTPSLLSPEEIGRILDAGARIFGIAEGAEISLEANPGTLTLESLRGYRLAGINRISLGLQSLSDVRLRRLGRSHTAGQGRQAVDWSRKAGFNNLSCDLMFALPGEDLSSLRSEIDAFLALAPDHLSCYGLTVEEATPFYHLHRAGELSLPEEEDFAAQFMALHQWLAEEGFGHYEISNYARPGFECRHNRRYWQRRSVLGVGAGAHSFSAKGWGRRSAAAADLEHFLNAIARGEEPAELLEVFDRRGAMAETLFLGLRTDAGVDEQEFRHLFATGVAEAFPRAVSQVGARLSLREGRWRMDLEGWLLYNHLITSFL